MKHRTLRIAWSAPWAILAMLLITLWVRSYFWLDNCLVLPNQPHAIVSLRGKLLMVTHLEVAYGPRDTSTMFDHYHPLIKTYSHRLEGIKIGALTATGTLPIWIPTILLAAAAVVAALYPPNRFGLRTLLIAMTLAAVGLGLIVWAMHG